MPLPVGSRARHVVKRFSTFKGLHVVKRSPPLERGAQPSVATALCLHLGCLWLSQVRGLRPGTFLPALGL